MPSNVCRISYTLPFLTYLYFNKVKMVCQYICGHLLKYRRLYQVKPAVFVYFRYRVFERIFHPHFRAIIFVFVFNVPHEHPSFSSRKQELGVLHTSAMRPNAKVLFRCFPGLCPLGKFGNRRGQDTPARSRSSVLMI